MPRALPCGAAAASLVLVLAVALAGCPAASADSLQFTVSDRPATQMDTARPVAPVPPAFVGVSMDYCAVPRYTGARADPVLVRLLLNLAPSRPVIRIGGWLTEPCPSSPQPLAAAPEAISALTRATDARLILGVDLLAGRGQIQDQVRTMVHAVASRRPSSTIDAFELGNEPDLYHRYGAFGPAADLQANFLKYLHDFERVARIVRQAVGDPRVGITGPSLSGPTSPWFSSQYLEGTDNFLHFVNGTADPDPIMFHVYPLHGAARCPGKLCASLPNLLLSHASHGFAVDLAPFARLVEPRRVLRVDEMNNVAQGGVVGVSNTFESALWALDTLFEYLHAGVEGVNVHTFNNAAYQLYSGPRPDGWLVFPEYFGLLTFARAAPTGSQLLAVARAPAPGAVPAVHVWATRARHGRTAIVVINESLAAQDVVLRGAGVPAKSSARLEWLRAPASSPTLQCPPAYATTGLCATGGVTLGGAGFGPSGDGIFGGEWTRTGSLKPGQGPACVSLERCTHQPPGIAIKLAMPPGSAAVVFGAGRPGSATPRAANR